MKKTKNILHFLWFLIFTLLISCGKLSSEWKNPISQTNEPYAFQNSYCFVGSHGVSGETISSFLLVANDTRWHYYCFGVWKMSTQQRNILSNINKTDFRKNSECSKDWIDGAFFENGHLYLIGTSSIQKISNVNQRDDYLICTQDQSKNWIGKSLIGKDLEYYQKIFLKNYDERAYKGFMKTYTKEELEEKLEKYKNEEKYKNIL